MKLNSLLRILAFVCYFFLIMMYGMMIALPFGLYMLFGPFDGISISGQIAVLLGWLGVAVIIFSRARKFQKQRKVVADLFAFILLIVPLAERAIAFPDLIRYLPFIIPAAVFFILMLLAVVLPRDIFIIKI